MRNVQGNIEKSRFLSIYENMKNPLNDTPTVSLGFRGFIIFC